MQKVFDTENADDMALLWDILPDDVVRIYLEQIECFKLPRCMVDFSDKSKDFFTSFITINWHDKTEITRPIQEATEADTCLNCLSGKVLFGEGIEIYGEEDDKDVTLEQCTGLRDKNGNLIYEGDIVKLSSEREVVCPVVWDNEETGFCVEYKKELYRFNTYKKYHLSEVIGNIHENAYLIKVG